MILTMALLAVLLVSAPATALTLVDWDATSFTSWNVNAFGLITSSPALPSANQFYISTANPRPGAASPEHLRVQWNSPDSWQGRMVFEGGSVQFTHFFATLYVSHSATWTPFSSGSTKQLVMKGPTGWNSTYLQASSFGDRQPFVVVQNMPSGFDNFLQNVNPHVAITPGGGYYRLDYEVKLNTPGQSDGIVRMFINNVKQLEYLNVNMGTRVGDVFNAVDADFLGSGSGTFPMYRDCDRIWVSTTAFDAGGVSGLNTPTNVLICKGAGCTPAMLLPVPVLIGVLVWVRRRLRRA
jgi:hypothetical protein